MKMKFIPPELVNLIADYHDYDKYCKPGHKTLFKNVLDNINDMAAIMPSSISPIIVWNCWGPGSKYLENSYENENMVGLYGDEDEYEAWLDMAHFDYEGGGWHN